MVMIRHSQYFTEKLFAESMIALIDIEKAISDYENGESSTISKSLYNTLKEELISIKKHVGDEIY